MYKTKPTMNKGLGEYDKDCHAPSQILHGYNGNTPDAIMSMNALFDAVYQGRKKLGKSSSRHMGYGVGLGELGSAAEIGTALTNKLGLEKGIDAAYNVMVALVASQHKVTVDNARGLLKIIKAEEAIR
jgi:hypothetical protein